MLYNHQIKYVLYISNEKDIQFLKYYSGLSNSTSEPMFVDENEDNLYSFNSVKEAMIKQKELKEKWGLITPL